MVLKAFSVLNFLMYFQLAECILIFFGQLKIKDTNFFQKHSLQCKKTSQYNTKNKCFPTLQIKDKMSEQD